MSFVEFDLQTFLRDMHQDIKADINAARAEAKKEHDELTEKVDSQIIPKIDSVVLTQAAHDGRIKTLEKAYGRVVHAAVWFVGAVIVGGITAAYDFISNHLIRKGGA